MNIILRRESEKIIIDDHCFRTNRKIIKPNDVIVVRYPNGSERIYRAKRAKLNEGMEIILLDDEKI